MKTDYPELEGLPVRLQGVDGKFIVAGCDYNIGITYKSKDNGKACFKKKDYDKGKGRKLIYRKIFHEMVRGIRNGLVPVDFEEAGRNYNDNVECPFEM